MCRMKFDRNFPEKDNLICFGLGLSLRNETSYGIEKTIYTLEYNFIDGISD